MAGKGKGSNGGKRNGGKRRQNGKKALTKREAGAVQKMINRTLDIRAEDKFSKDGSHLDLLGNYATAQQASYVDVTPTIYQGSGQAQQDGVNIFMKGLKLQMRATGGMQQSTVVAGTASSFSVDPLYARPAIRCYLVEVKHETIALQPVADMLQALAVRFRSPGFWKQDYDQSASNSLASAFKLVKHWTIPQRYNRAIVPVVNTGVGSQEMDIFHIPTQSFKDVYVPIKKKIRIEISTGEPLNNRYLLYACWLDNRANHTYAPKAPLQELSYRRCWIYEDS